MANDRFSMGEAVRFVWEAMKDNIPFFIVFLIVAWDLFLLGLLFFGISLLGVLACVFGLFAAIPTIWVAHAYVYRRLEYGAAPAQAVQVPEAV